MTTAIVPAKWPSPCDVEQFKDASLYEFPLSGEWTETRYSRRMMVDSAVIKLASSYGLSEYEKYVVREVPDNDAIRGNEVIEKFSNLGKLVDAYPSFRNGHTEFGEGQTHWLLLHRLQFDRLRNNMAIAPAIPEARFVYMSKPRPSLSPSISPTLVQQRVDGISLSDMVDHDAMDGLAPRQTWSSSYLMDAYRPFLPDIAEQLEPFTNREVAHHINWYIRNFTFDAQSRRLYYVDMKPSNIFGRWGNERNLKNLRRDFLESARRTRGTNARRKSLWRRET